jgi:hypothetical protein
MQSGISPPMKCDDCIASIFGVKEYAKQETSMNSVLYEHLLSLKYYIITVTVVS